MTHIAYHVTTDLTPAQHVAAATAASRQDDAVLAVFRHENRPLSPDEVLALLPSQCLLTSVRRAITNLTKAGALVKLHQYRDGPYGRPVGLWALPAGQGELLVGRAV